MIRLRAVVGLMLAAIATFLVSCGGPGGSPTVTTYSPDQLAELAVFTPGVTSLRERFPELEGYIQAKDWVNVRSFIHGPLGELRARLGRVSVRLLPQASGQAKQLADDLAVHLEKLDAAAAAFNQIEAGKQYRLALDDFDAFLDLVPDSQA